jgi:outer membrane cobalamin receptor
MRWYPISVVYRDRDVEGKFTTASCRDCGVEEALKNILNGTSLTWVRVGNQIILKERSVEEPLPFATISGILSDSLTGEWVAGANVLLQDSAHQVSLSARRWCPTNSCGFYSLRRVSPGRYLLVVRALGYRQVTVPVEATANRSIRRDLRLRQENIKLQEVTVEGQRTALALAGGGLARGIYIRSTPSDQNEYLLDGARIYNPSHFGGVLSTFNAEVLNDVLVVVGGLPPYYGGRIGGILDLSMRDGTTEHLAGSAGTGSLGSHLSLEGPLASGTTLIVSARRGYPDILVPFLRKDGVPSRLGSSELTAKVSHQLSGNSRISVSGYLGRDSYDNQVEGGGERLNNNFSWGNRVLNVRWIGIVSPSVFLQTSAVYTHYDFSLTHDLAGDPFLPSRVRFSSDYAVEDLSLRAHAEHYYDEEHTIQGGVELVHHRIAGNVSAFSSQTAPLIMQGSSSWELAVYLQDQWRILQRVTAELGVRATTFTGEQGSFSTADPRFSLLVSLDEQTRLYSSLTSINQFIHPYRNSGLFLFYPSIFWYPSTDQIKPSTSIQLTVGVESGDNTYLLSAETFYRITHNLHEFVMDTSVAPVADLHNAAIFGSGKSYGVELGLRKQLGDLSGSISYTLSWGRNTFAELNGGEPFNSRFDRRHELQIDSWYAVDESWAVGLLCVLASNLTPSLEPTSRQNYDPSDATRVGNALSSAFDLNGSRLPGFERLELKMQHIFSAWGLPCQFSLRLINGYGLLDPFVWELRYSSDVRSKWRAKLQEVRLFPLYPTIGLTVRF